MAMFKKQSKVSDKIPTSSMADIAFLLLIFFLVTTVFSEDRGLSLVLPERQTEVVEVNPKNIITYYVVGDGVVELRRGDSPDKQTIGFEQIEAVTRHDVIAFLTHLEEVIGAIRRAKKGVQHFNPFTKR